MNIATFLDCHAAPYRLACNDRGGKWTRPDLYLVFLGYVPYNYHKFANRVFVWYSFI